MNLVPCTCQNRGPYEPCTCARSQSLRQWHELEGSTSQNPVQLHAKPTTATSSLPTTSTVSYGYHATHDQHDPNVTYNHSPHIYSNVPITNIPTTNVSSTTFPLHRPPLQDSRSAVNVPPQQPPPQQSTTSSRGTRRRQAHSGQNNANKRQRTVAAIPSFPTSTICGVGPPSEPAVTQELPTQGSDENSQPPATSLPTERYPSQKRTKSHNAAAATDVYYFCRATDATERPSDLPTTEPILERKPQSTYLGCKLCR
jgi:hypothetical protein